MERMRPVISDQDFPDETIRSGEKKWKRETGKRSSDFLIMFKKASGKRPLQVMRATWPEQF